MNCVLVYDKLKKRPVLTVTASLYYIFQKVLRTCNKKENGLEDDLNSETHS